jgi:predicted alpha-1,2-mannosidase
VEIDTRQRITYPAGIVTEPPSRSEFEVTLLHAHLMKSQWLRRPASHSFVPLLFALGSFLCSPAEALSPADQVDPFIGAITQSKARHSDSQGKTFPGAATPYGLVQLSPDSISEGDNGSGYNFEHTTLMGFSFTHMSGVGWYGDLGNLLVMPATGPLKTGYGETDQPGTGYLSRKTNETASAGYYAVTLVDYGVRAELTAAPRSGMLRFTFPKHDQSRIQLDLARRVGGTAVMESLKVVGEDAIEGWMRCTPEGGGWGNGDGQPNYTVYFHARFSKSLQKVGVWEVEIPDGAKRKHQEHDAAFLKAMAGAQVLPGCREKTARHIGFYTEFSTRDQEQVLMKAGISFTSLEGARRNLEQDIPGWDFDAVRSAARDRWDRELSRISIEGGSAAQRTAFYTALYHAMLDPRAFADSDGSYPGGDLARSARKSEHYTRRTIFSGWDVYRSQFPLMTLLAPQVCTDTINSLCDLALESGNNYLERWEFLNAYSGCMNGHPAVPVIADAWAKGLRGFDAQKAYDLARKTCERSGNNERGFVPGNLSDTTEYCLDDWCVSRMARGLGHTADAERFLARSRGWRNLYDPDSNWFKGSCVEANPGQQGWFVPHDIPGLIQLVGGPEKFIARLDDFFRRTPQVEKWNDFYNHANEPVHLVPFLFNRAGAPWLTQKWVRFICEHAYGTGPYGLCGDEDVGQMSAWFILSASGFHQACPGDTRYELFTPLFDRVQVRIDPLYGQNRTFTLVTHGNGPGERYIQSAKLNGQPLARCWIDHSEIVAGGILELELAAKPNKSWGLNR